MSAIVLSVSVDSTHNFSKPPVESIELLAGLGVKGDAHCGVTVKHRSRVRADPSQPNLRQVHLIHSELFAELLKFGFSIQPGNMGENILTQGIDLLSLPRGTQLSIGPTAVVEITGLRNPCRQLDAFQDGLMAATLDQDQDGNLLRKAGVMGIVLRSGVVSAESRITITLPAPPHSPLDRV